MRNSAPCAFSKHHSTACSQIIFTVQSLFCFFLCEATVSEAQNSLLIILSKNLPTEGDALPTEFLEVFSCVKTVLLMAASYLHTKNSKEDWARVLNKKMNME